MSSSNVVKVKRKRCRREMEDASDEQSNNERNVQGDEANRDNQPILPLEGVIACLSGFAQDRKDHLHNIILSLGGRYTRELNLDKNTHLITEAAQGAKYNLAVSSDPKSIHIITSSWLSSTMESGQRASEMAHVLASTMDSSEGNQTQTRSSSKSSVLSLMDNALDEVVAPCDRLSRSFLFEKFQFFLIGFESSPELKMKTSVLIRRGGGTIHWDMNEEISILVLSDACDDAVQKAAKIVTSHHPNIPPAVSPFWIIESYKGITLQPTANYPPIRTRQPKLRSNEGQIRSSKRASEVTSRTTSLASTASNVSIFRGCLFSSVRTSPTVELGSSLAMNPIIEFNQKEIDNLIKAHGGKILCTKLLDALRIDAEKSTSEIKRKCHVVCWGGSPPRLDTNPLVSQLKRHNLCELILVTPIWVQTCVSVKRRLRPEYMPVVFVPQSWSMKSVKLRSEEVGGKRRQHSDAVTKLQISLTGFQGSEKAMLINLIRAIGGVYHGNMSSATTHLVFKNTATGLKQKKAIEWGLRVVSVQWLYHILEHGYRGVHKDEVGCENRFSMGIDS